MGLKNYIGGEVVFPPLGSFEFDTFSMYHWPETEEIDYVFHFPVRRVKGNWEYLTLFLREGPPKYALAISNLKRWSVHITHLPDRIYTYQESTPHQATIATNYLDGSEVYNLLDKLAVPFYKWDYPKVISDGKSRSEYDFHHWTRELASRWLRIWDPSIAYHRSPWFHMPEWSA